MPVRLVGVGPGRDQFVSDPTPPDGGRDRACVSWRSGGREHALAAALGRTRRGGGDAGQPGHPGVGRHPAGRGRGRPVRRRARGAARRRPGRPSCGPTGRLVFGPGADGARLEGSKAYMKELVAAAGVPTARLRRLHRGGRRPRLPGDAGAALRREDRRPGRRQGRAGHRLARADAAADVADKLAGAQLRRRRPAGGHRGGPGRARAVAARGVRRHAGPSPSPRRRTSSASATATPGPNTGGMGAYSPVPGLGDDVVGVVMDTLRRAHPRRAAPPGHRLPRRALRRPHADRRRPEAHRVQRPLRRPRVAGRAAPPHHRPGRAARRGGGRVARHHADVRRRRTPSRSCCAARATPPRRAPAT